MQLLGLGLFVLEIVKKLFVPILAFKDIRSWPAHLHKFMANCVHFLPPGGLLYIYLGNISLLWSLWYNSKMFLLLCETIKL